MIDLDPCVGDMLHPLIGIFRQTTSQQAAKGFRQRRQSIPVWIAAKNRTKRLRDGITGEWAAAAKHLVQHAAEAPDIGPSVERAGLTRRLLRTHIRRSAHDDSI